MLPVAYPAHPAAYMAHPTTFSILRATFPILPAIYPASPAAYCKQYKVYNLPCSCAQQAATRLKFVILYC
jgi:hypothetical protein